jgi:GntR family transcriptional regulator
MASAPSQASARSRDQAQRFAPDPGVALHHQVKEDLLLKIHAGVWLPGSETPSEAHLCAHYGVSRGTLRRALGELAADGYLRRERGRGTFVAQPKLEMGLADSFGRFKVIGPSLDTASRVVACRRVRAAEAVASVLRLAPGTSIWQLERVRLAGGKPAALQTSYLDAALYPGLERHDLEQRYLYQVMSLDYGVFPVRVVELVDPTSADAYVAKKLAVKAGTALFRIERTTYAPNDRVAEFRLSLLRGDLFRYRNEYR